MYVTDLSEADFTHVSLCCRKVSVVEKWLLITNTWYDGVLKVFTNQSVFDLPKADVTRATVCAIQSCNMLHNFSNVDYFVVLTS